MAVTDMVGEWIISEDGMPCHRMRHITAKPAVDECSHEWVAGMMVVNDEDVAAIAAIRRVECSKCEQPYQA